MSIKQAEHKHKYMSIKQAKHKHDKYMSIKQAKRLVHTHEKNQLSLFFNNDFGFS